MKASVDYRNMKNTNVKTWLKPREIAKRRLIVNSVNGTDIGNYDFIIKLIRSGKLKAKDYGTKSRSFYLVSLDEVERYNNQVDN